MEDGHRLSKAILKRALASSLSAAEEGIEISSFDVSEGSAKGENFVCVMKAVSLRAMVNGKEDEYHFMVKCYPMNELRVKFLTEVSKPYV